MAFKLASKLAKRAGLLHDIGKVPDDEPELPHAILGMKLAERNKWIEDCYLIIGQAQFYKHDFWTAIETFQYTSSEYKTGDVRFEALIWLTRAYLELGKTTDAGIVRAENPA